MKIPKELEAFTKKELALKSEIEELISTITNREYRTKTEKKYFSDLLQLKRQELREHLDNPPAL